MQRSLTGSKHIPIKVLLTLISILCALWLGLSRQFYAMALYEFFPWVMTSV
jgi:hypothetical protein